MWHRHPASAEPGPAYLPRSSLTPAQLLQFPSHNLNSFRGIIILSPLLLGLLIPEPGPDALAHVVQLGGAAEEGQGCPPHHPPPTTSSTKLPLL